MGLENFIQCSLSHSASLHARLPFALNFLHLSRLNANVISLNLCFCTVGEMGFPIIMLSLVSTTHGEYEISFCLARLSRANVMSYLLSVSAKALIDWALIEQQEASSIWNSSNSLIYQENTDNNTTLQSTGILLCWKVGVIHAQKPACLFQDRSSSTNLCMLIPPMPMFKAMLKSLRHTMLIGHGTVPSSCCLVPQSPKSVSIHCPSRNRSPKRSTSRRLFNIN